MISKEMGLSIEEFQKYYVRKGCAKGRDLGGSISCIYLLQLGKLGDLHKRFNITPFDKNGEICANLYDDNDIVYKYGRTDNLKKRIVNHKHEFRKFGITNIQIIDFARMDPENLCVAEDKLKNFIESLGCRIEAKSKGANSSEAKKFKEFAVLKDHLNVVWTRCIDLEKEYTKQIHGINKEMQELTTKLTVYETELREAKKRDDEAQKRDQENKDRIQFLEKTLTYMMQKNDNVS